MNDFSKSDLNLSQSGSHNHPAINKPVVNSFNEKQSFCFNFEGEKKKKGGVSITSKNKNNNSTELLKVEGDILVSKRDHVKIDGDVFVSKRAESKEKLINNLKNNEEYLLDLRFKQ